MPPTPVFDSGPSWNWRVSRKKAAGGCRTPRPRRRSTRAGRARRSARADSRLNNPSSKSGRGCRRRLSLSANLARTYGHRSKRRQGAAALQALADDRGARVGLVAPREPIAGLTIPHRNRDAVPPTPLSVREPCSYLRASQQKAAGGCRTPRPRGRSRGASVFWNVGWMIEWRAGKAFSRLSARAERRALPVLA